MRVKMLEDAPGSPDGVTVNEYSEGEVYDVSQSLGDVFIQYGLAVEAEDESADAEPVKVPEGDDTDGKTKKDTGPKENK